MDVGPLVLMPRKEVSNAQAQDWWLWSHTCSLAPLHSSLQLSRLCRYSFSLTCLHPPVCQTPRGTLPSQGEETSWLFSDLGNREM